MNKIAGEVIGLLLGLAVSYLLRPQSIFGSPDFQTWFTKGFEQKETAPTIIICGIVGLVIGLVVGALLDKNFGSEKKLTS